MSSYLVVGRRTFVFNVFQGCPVCLRTAAVEGVVPGIVSLFVSLVNSLPSPFIPQEDADQYDVSCCKVW